MEKINPQYIPPQTELVIQKDKFIQQLEERIRSGEEILSFLTKKEVDFDTNKKNYSFWNDFNSEYLKQSFNNENNEYKDNYDNCAMYIGFGKNRTGLQGELTTFEEKVKAKVTSLKKLLNKADLLKSSIEEANKKKMEKNKIFISHSTEDAAIVRLFVENILVLGLGINMDRIFCSSIRTRGVKSGERIQERLKNEIKSSCIAFLFCSKNYEKSKICLYEFGALWVTLEDNKIIPIVFPDIDFKNFDLLLFGKLSIKINESAEIEKLIENHKSELNPNFTAFSQLSQKIKDFLSLYNISNQNQKKKIDESLIAQSHLIALDKVIRKAIPAKNDGIYRIDDAKLKEQILVDFANIEFLEDFWYRFSSGDYYIKKLQELPSGNWLMSNNWEIKISELWVSLNTANQYEFILIRSEKQEPFKITSDIGGESYEVGILNGGEIISSNERLNGFAIFNGKPVDLSDKVCEIRYRNYTSNWVFLSSQYHKVGYNAEQVIEFCEQLDLGNIEVNATNIMTFLRKFKNDPVFKRLL
jgi:hypothetical protein